MPTFQAMASRLRAAAVRLAAFLTGATLHDAMKAPAAIFRFECRAPDGTLRWAEEQHNLVLTAGKNFALDTLLKGSAYTAAWYLLLKGAGAIAAADTLASHAGWAELQPYAGTNRPAITWGATSAGQNTATGVVVSINTTATIAGAGITNSQTGTGGNLYNATDFANARSLFAGDTLTVTVTMQMT